MPQALTKNTSVPNAVLVVDVLEQTKGFTLWASDNQGWSFCPEILPKPLDLDWVIKIPSTAKIKGYSWRKPKPGSHLCKSRR